MIRIPLFQYKFIKVIQAHLRGISCLLLILAFISCNKYTFIDCETYDYSNCLEAEPSTGNLEIRISITPDQASVPITIYEGHFPSQTIVLRDTLVTSIRNIILPVSKSYSVTAEYKRSGKIVLAVDGDEITKKSYKVCDAVCWEVKDASVDLRLTTD